MFNNLINDIANDHNFLDKIDCFLVDKTGNKKQLTDSLELNKKSVNCIPVLFYSENSSRVNYILFYENEDDIPDEYYVNKYGYYSNKGVKYNKKTSVFREHQLSLKSIFNATELGSKSPSYLATKNMQYTFGVEIETISGRLPLWAYLKNKLSLTCIRDGSLRNPDGSETGGEYVTGVLKGDLGLYNLKKSLSEISKRCNIDPRCGIHLHVGGCNFNPQFNVLAYILALKIEDEVFTTLPPSRRNNNTCGRLKSKNYLETLKKFNLHHGIDICYVDLFQDLSNGRTLAKNLNRSFSHPGGRYTDRYSRNIPPEKLFRYKWLNFISSNFNMKGSPENPIYTLEFRCHPASLNYQKISNWILFCFAFCYYVENNIKDIIYKDNITINDILKFAYPKDYQELTEYFDERKEIFKDLENAVKVEANEYKQTTVKKVENIKQAILK